MVDVLHPYPMPPTLSSSQYGQNTSLPSLYAGGSAFGDRQACSGAGRPYTDYGQSLVPAEIRHGLRTPPRDMSGVSVNPLLASNLGGHQYKSVPAVAPNASTQQNGVGTNVNTRYTARTQPSQNGCHRRDNSYEHLSTDKATLQDQTSKAHNGADGTSIVSYLQIPSTINESKGSLAEFAAQVNILTFKHQSSEY